MANKRSQTYAWAYLSTESAKSETHDLWEVSWNCFQISFDSATNYKSTLYFLENPLNISLQSKIQNSRHPFYDLLQRLNKYSNNSRSRDLYIKWLKEDEGNQKWNSTFSHDPTFLASIEHLKPDARSDSDRIMTQYSVEQNRDSKMNMYNYIDRKIIMKKVPNYQYGIDTVSLYLPVSYS